eukprot:6154503-Pyramimonas_sp.AAC.1
MDGVSLTLLTSTAIYSGNLIHSLSGFAEQDGRKTAVVYAMSSVCAMFVPVLSSFWAPILCPPLVIR